MKNWKPKLNFKSDEVNQGIRVRESRPEAVEGAVVAPPGRRRRRRHLVVVGPRVRRRAH